MNTAKHTPGPWNCVDPHVIRGPKNVVIAKTLDSKEGYEIKQANAHLIAAAPAMYEALKAIQEKISGADVLFDPNPQWEGEQARYDAAQEALFLVDQALAQAEGK